MTSRPSHFVVIGQKVLDEIVNKAGDEVRASVLALLKELQGDPYPRAGRYNVAEMRGVGMKHLYVAWCDEAQVSYRVAQDQPAILLVGVHWFSGPNGPGNGEDADGFEFPLAA